MGYDIRNEAGILVMTVDNRMAQHMINSSKGVFTPYKAAGCEATTCFELSEAYHINLPHVKVFLWEKTKLIPKQ